MSAHQTASENQNPKEASQPLRHKPMSASPRGLIVTGTDTNVGKTYVSAALLNAAKTYFSAPAYWKPIQTGQDDDTLTVEGLSQGKTFSPAYRFQAPLSPHLAAAREGQRISESVLHEAKSIREKETDFLIIEGAGGWLVPLRDDLKFGQVAAHWNLPVVVVIKDILGALNHTLLTLEAIQSRGLQVKGLILNQRVDEVGNFEALLGLCRDLPLWSLPPRSGLTCEPVSWHPLFS